MSSKISGRVWDLDLPHAHMLILHAMTDHADHLGANMYPSIGLIAWKTGYSERQVMRVIDELVRDGLLVRTKSGGGRGYTNTYRIDFASGRFKPAYVPRKKGDMVSGFRTKDAPLAQKGDICDEKGDICAVERVTFATEKGDICDVNPDIAVSPKPLTVQNLDDDEDTARACARFVAVWEDVFGYPFPERDRAAIADLVAQGIPLNLWRRACDRAAQTFAPRFHGDRIQRARYVLKCLASILGETAAAAQLPIPAIQEPSHESPERIPVPGQDPRRPERQTPGRRVLEGKFTIVGLPSAADG